MGEPPPGTWYQEAKILGKKMPQRRLKDTNEKRWKRYVEPLISFESGVFTDLGCNAGFYCRKMIDKGFTVYGVEKSTEFINHAYYWETCHPKGVKFYHSDIMNYRLTC